MLEIICATGLCFSVYILNYLLEKDKKGYSKWLLNK